MRKAFLFTMVTFVLLSSLYLIMASFSIRQADFMESMAEETVGYRIFQIWSDVEESIEMITDFDIDIDDYTVIVYDHIPKPHDNALLLTNYGKFIENVYEPSNIDIAFKSVDGTAIPLDQIPTYLEIRPFSIIYDYLFYGQNELFMTVPNENFTSIENIILDVKVTNKNITEISWDWAPYKSCTGLDCIFMTIIVHDNYVSHTFAEKVFSRSQQSKTQVDLSGAGWVDIIIGTQDKSTQNVFKVSMHNGQAETVTTLLLNTTEFSVVYPAKLSVKELNYNITKEDWF